MPGHFAKIGIARGFEHGPVFIGPLHDAVAVLGRLDVERDDVRAGLSEGLDLRLGMLDHQVDIEDALRCLAQALDDR